MVKKLEAAAGRDSETAGATRATWSPERKPKLPLPGSWRSRTLRLPNSNRTPVSRTSETQSTSATERADDKGHGDQLGIPTSGEREETKRRYELFHIPPIQRTKNGPNPLSIEGLKLHPQCTGLRVQGCGFDYNSTFGLPRFLTPAICCLLVCQGVLAQCIGLVPLNVDPSYFEFKSDAQDQATE